MKSDFEAGKQDAQGGYYDKWYRYNRKDGGKEYDAGWQSSLNEGTNPDSIIFISGN